MSIWTSPLFGKARVDSPASRAAVRCARIQAAGSFDIFPAGVIGYFVGFGVFVVELYAALTSAAVNLGIAPGSAVLEFVKGFEPGAFALFVGFILLFAMGMPLAMRWVFDRRVGGMTRESVAKKRRLRRRAARITLGLGLLMGAIAIAWPLLMPWQGAAVAMAKVASSTGCAIIGIAIFGRRGSRLSCAACSYPMSSWLGAPEQCPECGSMWRSPWRARFGQRGVRLGWLAVGASLVAVSAGVMGVFAAWGLN